MASIRERLQHLEQDLIRQRKRTDATTTLTVIVGILALVAVAGYSYYGYKEISWAAEPERVVQLGEQMLDDNIPKLRRQLEDEIKKSAPEWAATLSKEALEQLPVGRKHLEKLTVQYLDESLNETTSMTDEQFRKFLDNNK